MEELALGLIAFGSALLLEPAGEELQVVVSISELAPDPRKGSDEVRPLRDLYKGRLLYALRVGTRLPRYEVSLRPFFKESF